MKREAGKGPPRVWNTWRAFSSVVKKVLLPAGTIKLVDPNEEKVMVNRTKDQIKNSPEFDPDTYRDDRYRSEIGTYYGPGGTGWRDW